MSVRRESDGDAAAAAMAERAVTDYGGPVMLTGYTAHRVRQALIAAETVLKRAGKTKEPRLARDIREARIEIGAVLPYVARRPLDPSTPPGGRSSDG